MNRGWLCLMYHEVLPDAPAAGSRDYFAVSRASFGRDLDAVRAAGYRGCSLVAALEAASERRVAITFDDGTIGQFEHALPELLARGMTATFFVTTGWIGRVGHVGWDQLRALRDAGMEIGSHTRSHPFLSELQRDAVWAELQGSRDDLERALGSPVRSLALPGGDAPRTSLRALLPEAGYHAVATSRWGANADPPGPGAPHFIRRCTVGRAADATELQRVLSFDPALFVRRRARGAVLGAVRRALGPTRYARWRRRFLDAAT